MGLGREAFLILVVLRHLDNHLFLSEFVVFFFLTFLFENVAAHTDSNSSITRRIWPKFKESFFQPLVIVVRKCHGNDISLEYSRY